MPYTCKILADSINSRGKRLTTFQATYPRYIHAEVMTHRALSRNTASSRAIPVWKMILSVIEDPVIPIFGKNQKGMQSKELLTGDDYEEARAWWIEARNDAVYRAFIGADRSGKSKAEEEAWKYIQDWLCELGYNIRGWRHGDPADALGLHKQTVNRILEPYLWHTAIITGTDWANFFALRCHEDAQPEIQVISRIMMAEYKSHNIKAAPKYEWHLPFIEEEDILAAKKHLHIDDPNAWVSFGTDLFPYGTVMAEKDALNRTLAKISAARCARVSYLTHDGKRDILADLDLYKRLVESVPCHMSPTEHCAMSMDDENYYGNLCGFKPLRKMLPNENITELI